MNGFDRIRQLNQCNRTHNVRRYIYEIYDVHPLPNNTSIVSIYMCESYLNIYCNIHSMMNRKYNLMDAKSIY